MIFFIPRAGCRCSACAIMRFSDSVRSYLPSSVRSASKHDLLSRVEPPPPSNASRLIPSHPPRAYQSRVTMRACVVNRLHSHHNANMRRVRLLRDCPQHGRVPIFFFFLLVCHRTEGAVLILHLNRHSSVCVARCTQLWHNVRQLLHCARYDATLHHLPTECRAECSAHTIQSGIRRYSMQWRIASSVGCTTDFAAVTFASRQSFLTLLPAQHAKQHCTCSPPHRCQREHARGAGQHPNPRVRYMLNIALRTAAYWMPCVCCTEQCTAHRAAPS